MPRVIKLTMILVGFMICASAYADLKEGLVAAWTFATGTALPATELKKWHHVALVEDGTKGIAYLDGKSGLGVTGGDANPSSALRPTGGTSSQDRLCYGSQW